MHICEKFYLLNLILKDIVGEDRGMKKNFYSNYLIIKRSTLLLWKLDKKYIVKIIAVSLATAIFPVISILLTEKLINSLQGGNEQLKSTIYILLMYMFVRFINSWAQSYINYILLLYSDYLMDEMNVLFQEKCTNLEYIDFENSDVYDMLSRAEQQIGVRFISIIKNLSTLLTSIVNLICLMIIISHLSLFLIIGFAILPILSFKYFAKINQLEYQAVYKRASEERKSWYLSHLLIKDIYVKEVKNLGLTKYFLEKFKLIKHKIFKENSIFLKRKFYFNLFYQMSNLIFTFAIISYSIYKTIIGKLLIGTFLTYINTASRIEVSINNITLSCFSLYTDALYSKNILDFFDFIDRKEKKQKMHLEKQISFIHSIEFKNVSFKYPKSEHHSLKNFSYKFITSDTYNIVGENGSGKTTLIKLLIGLYTVYEGDILINGINIKEISYEEYKRLLSVVFQDYNKYEFDIYSNISFGDILSEQNEKRVEYAAQFANINDFIDKFGERYRQQLGNWFGNGIQLSGGQWQKLAIARGVFRNAEVFIFDEPTASLDPNSSRKVFQNIFNDIRDKMVIFTTHGYANTKLVGNILVLKKGALIETGTHESLIEQKGEYYMLYKNQSGDME